MLDSGYQRARFVVPLAFALALALALGPTAVAQDPWVYQGGTPGIVVTAAGTPIIDAATPGSAIRIDPDVPLEIAITLAPPGNTTWEVRAISVGLIVGGPGSPPPDALMRRVETNSSIPPGWTVVVNRTIDLSALKKVGAGTFLMQAEVRDDHDLPLYSQTFYVHVPATAASILTVQGATITVVSVATGYGFWQVAKDGKELRDAWERHRKKKQIAKLDVYGQAEHAVENVISKGGAPLAGAVSFHRDIQESEKKLGIIRWSATGLGLGGVLIAWLQFLGYIAFSVVGLVTTALEGAAIFLTLALVANALLKRAWKKAEAPEPATRTLIPEDVGAQPAAAEVALEEER